MADEQDLLKEFTEFMASKQAAEAESSANEEEVEVWDKDGNGARIKFSHAKPFLQKLGIALDPAPSTPAADDKGTKGTGSDGGGKAKPVGRTTGPGAPTLPDGSVRRYFTSK